MVCGVSYNLNANTMACSVALNSQKIAFVLQPARSDVKIGPAVNMKIG